ncbi:hypothetical protein LTR94_029579, partial [Friedmanniomyces endolithicus]
MVAEVPLHAAQLVAGTTIDDVRAALADPYAGSALVRVADSDVATVAIEADAGTDRMTLRVFGNAVNGQLRLVATLDNLGKGAAGAAVQNLNIMAGLDPETPVERNPVGKLLLFGATGDLARRMLLPSLYGLHADGLLPEGLTITGSARGDLDDDGFRAEAKKALDEFLPADRKDEAALSGFLKRLQFQPVDLSDENTFAPLAEKIGDVSGGLAIFLSTAPSLFEPA